jgi:hypothetical protein
VRRVASILLLVLAAGALAACGDDNDDATTAPGSIVTQTEPTETSTAPSSENPSGETADLPLCSEVEVRPCRTASGAVLEEGGANAGEIADLPLCSEAPPPCRTPDGELVEP